MRLLVLAVLLLPACSRAPAPPGAAAATVRLSTENADANAPEVALFFVRTCLDAAADQAAFEQALQNSGWEVERTQTASPANPINAWQVDRGALYQSFVEVSPGRRLVDCHVELPGTVAPSVERVDAALRPLIRHASLRAQPHGPQEASWQWRPSPSEERAVTISLVAPRPNRDAAAGRRGVAIHFSSTPAGAPPDPGVPGG